MEKAILILIILIGLFSSCKKEEVETEPIIKDTFLIVGDQAATIKAYGVIIYDSSDYDNTFVIEFDIDMDGVDDFSFNSVSNTAHCWMGVTLYFSGLDNCKLLVTDTIPWNRKAVALNYGDTIEYSKNLTSDFAQVVSNGYYACHRFNGSEVKNESMHFSEDLNDYIGIIYEKENSYILCWVKLSSPLEPGIRIIKLLEIGYTEIPYNQ